MEVLGVPVEAVRSVEEARALVGRLQARENELEEELDVLLEQQTQMDVRMSAFQHMLPNLGGLHGNAKELSHAMAQATVLADSVSSKVRTLDLAKTHVYAAMKRVDDVIDLKNCVDGVQLSLSSGDYEKAAAHIHRYLMLDEGLRLDNAEEAVADACRTSASFALLREAEVELKELVRAKFAEASEKKDMQSIERFFRIFPLLNLHEEGLVGFSIYLRQMIAETALKNLHSAAEATGERAGVVYADTLTLLFEGIARTIEKHLPEVETYYGPAWMHPLILKLQEECDCQVEKIVSQLTEERMLEHKVQTINVALKARMAAGAIRPNVLELDTLLSELSLCSARTELYFRFLQRKAGNSAAESGPSLAAVMKGSKTSHVIQELIGKYILLENYFMQESLTKAISMDNNNPDGLTSSMSDDIFFVLQKCTRRAFSSANVDGACAMMNHAGYLLVADYSAVLQSRLKVSVPSSGLDFSGMIQSKLQSTMSTNAESEASKIATAMVALNDAEVSIENLLKLTKELQAEVAKMASQAGEGALRKLDSCLSDLSSAGTTLKDIRQNGIIRMVEVLILPKVRPAVEVFCSLGHALTEEEYSNFEVNDPFGQQLMTTTESALKEHKGGFLPALYEQLLDAVMSELARLLEVQVLKCSFNQLGGVQLDKDLRLLVGYLSSLTQWPVRDRFTRLMQIALLLNLETVGEVLEYWGDSAGTLVWRLSPTEVRKVLHLRNDFRPDEIDRMKL